MPEPRFSFPGRPHQRGGTLFEQMQRSSNAPPPPQTAADPITVARAPITANQDLVVVEKLSGDVDSAVRFDRAEVDGLPGIVMQQRQSDGSWGEIWSFPTQSIDAREGMFGWLNTQSHRWDRFARMLHRRGGDELTAWIFELMVQPTAAAARPPRVQTETWTTIDQYHRPRVDHAMRHATTPRFASGFQHATVARVDNCVCRRNPRDF